MKRPTAKQVELLKQLDLLGYSTVEMLHEYQAESTGKRALQSMLRRLESGGYVARGALHPELGGRSEYYWYLTRQGARFVGPNVQLLKPSLAAAQDWILPASDTGPKPVGNQETILGLLVELKQLRTDQIGEYIFGADAAKRPIMALRRLREKGYITSAPLTGSQRLYWMLTEKGAALHNLKYGSDYRREPRPETLDYRGLKLRARKQAENAGWRLLFPTRRPVQPVYDPREVLVRAILAVERAELLRLMELGRPVSELSARVERANRSDIGITLPERIGDCVAKLPGQTERAALVIIAPSYPSENFWLRAGRPMNRGWDRPEPRVARYRLLAEVLPVLVVVETRALMETIQPILSQTPYEPILLDDLSSRFLELRRGKTSNTKA